MEGRQFTGGRGELLKDKRRGHCVICGSRVFSDEEYVESAQGYCHVNCLTESSILEQDQVAEKPA